MILDNLGSGLLTVDAAGVVTRINPMARTILGLAELVGAQLLNIPVAGPAGIGLNPADAGQTQGQTHAGPSEHGARID